MKYLPLLFLIGCIPYGDFDIAMRYPDIPNITESRAMDLDGLPGLEAFGYGIDYNKDIEPDVWAVYLIKSAEGGLEVSHMPYAFLYFNKGRLVSVQYDLDFDGKIDKHVGNFYWTAYWILKIGKKEEK